jgi:DnaD/phage-associated family protein
MVSATNNPTTPVISVTEMQPLILNPVAEIPQSRVDKIRVDKIRVLGDGISGANIFTFYEQNIGIISPILADKLRDAEGEYSEEWVRDAISEAVNYGKKSWAYIQAILERWKTDGKTNRGKHGEGKGNPTTNDRYSEENLRESITHPF